MDHPIFYVPQLEGKLIALPEEEAKHAIRVLRLDVGDVVQVTDGVGGWHRGEVSAVDKRNCAVSILDSAFEYGKPKMQLHMACAPTKNIARFEWFLEKATELGVQEITPTLCQRSERKVIKPERLNRILVAAMKQSQRAYLPVLNPMVSLNEFLKSNNAEQRFIAHCLDEPARDPLLSACQPETDTTILIGPEGDFSLDEVKQALGTGFAPISLGNARLRTETAALAACHIVNLLNP